MHHGFLNIDKAPGMTSHDVVAQVRRLAGQKRVGHGGTLDPLATGVLPVGLGEATRLLEYLVEGQKRYAAVVRLGATTTTDDAAGAVTATAAVPALDIEAIQAALVPFTGTIQQVPPMYSAIQVGGQRMYDLARRGEHLDLAPRTVEIARIDVESWAAPDLALTVVCGKGTYIRALARDLGAALGCGAHLASLRRTQVGALDISTAVTLDELRADPARLAAALQPPMSAVADWPSWTVDERDQQRLGNGLAITTTLAPDRPARAHAADGRLLALLAPRDGQWWPFKLFNLG